MKQEIEQAVDEITEQEPSPDQLDLGEPYEFSGQLFSGDKGSVEERVIEDLAQQARRQIGYYWLGEFSDQFQSNDMAIWIGDVGAELPTGQQVVNELLIRQQQRR